uniref:UPAR/Ly6 domain-containing protein n=1 Tax=Leptobrachium leishanense TaxID=445787 RepID=A0A8C5WHC6_9ANUR
MDSTLPLLCLFFALIHSGDARSCIECYNTAGDSCTGPSKVCQTSDDVCMSGVLTFGSLGLFGRSCVQGTSSCNMSGSLLNGQVQLATSCCNSDNCNPQALTLLPSKPETNGLKCLACPETGVCDISPMYCTGQEKWCADVVLSGNSESLATIKGCATESVCTFGNQTFDIDGVLMHLGIYCTQGTSDGVISADPRRSPLIVTFVALLMGISLA